MLASTPARARQEQYWVVRTFPAAPAPAPPAGTLLRPHAGAALSPGRSGTRPLTKDFV